MSNLTKKVNIENINASGQEQETVFTNAITFFQATSNNFALMAKAHFRGSSFFLGNVLIPILISTGVSLFFPMTYGFVWTLYLSMTFSGMATYGTVFFSIRKSSIVKNINLTATESGTLYMATFMLIGLSLFITFSVIIGWTVFLDVTGVAIYEFAIYNNGNPAGIWYIDWLEVMTSQALWYYWIEQVFLCFSLSFFFEKVVSTQKNFFILTFAYILAGIFFSGIFTNTLYVTSNGMVDVVDESTTLEELNGIAVLKPYMWGHTGWWVGQFFPHFGANQLVATSSQSGAYQYAFDPTTFEVDYTEIIYNKWYNLNIFSCINSWKVSYYAAMPWIWTIVLIWISAMIERYDKNRS